MQNKLDQMKTMTTIVVDTGDIEAVKKYAPTDATTNPSLILAAVQKPQYRPLIEEALQYARSQGSSKEQRHSLLMDKLFINFGLEILKYIPGRVSTEVDARLSFDTEASIQKARKFIAMYEASGISRERILIKLASTWEGIQAASQLEKEGIHCNMTLLFSLPQAIACGDVKATLISPFVGRILDWYKKYEPQKKYSPNEDPGVVSVNQIYIYFKKFDYQTEIMGASFRNIDQILELSGCDLLTISPQLLDELHQAQGSLIRKLDHSLADNTPIERLHMNEKTFRFLLNENAMATEKLAEGIRKFTQDTIQLEKQVLPLLS